MQFVSLSSRLVQLDSSELLFNFGFYGWQLIIIATIFLNWYRIEKRGIKPHYFASNYSRAFFGLVCLLLMSARDGFDGIDFAYPRTLIPYIPHMTYIATSFYLFFDPGLSVLRGRKWNYRGKNSGWFDRLPISLYYALKVACVAGLIWSLTKLF